MDTKSLVAGLWVTLAGAVLAWAAASTTQPTTKPALLENMPGARSEVYKRVGDIYLNMYIFEPTDHKTTDRRAAVVFFFGGGWRSGSPVQFTQQCRYLASRGMVAMAAEYRIHNRHQAKIVDCVADAKSAVRWVRENARRLGIDPERIAAGGGSAGGHLAASTGTITEFDDPNENRSISSRPNAMLLFNPALDLVRSGSKRQLDSRRHADFIRRMGADPRAVSPQYHVDSRTPPAIIFHGTEDTTVPYAQVEAFAETMTRAGRRCDVVGSKGQGHGFFNYGRDGQKHFIATMRDTDRFLASLKFISGPPTIDAFMASRP